MVTLTLSKKAQVTLRRELLDHLGVLPGDRITLEKRPGGALQLRAAPKRKIQELFGMLKPPGGKHATLEEIKAAIEAGWAGES
ncbi:MAG TPA: AbrB/MazE/SpoVT family DNA-binding domain-containing protein [Caulobacteraceae bacterium]|nr:AbrB/MazE/SpoVT family DNA-binding domain-containing protein [Caulobacteraceae bacterium]